jgi:carbon-monoxide dehydrogenase medium subunit
LKPAPFQYIAAQDVGAAVGLLTEHGSEAKLLAGGQSLVPMMNFRLVRPGVLIDLNPITQLSGIAASDAELVIGSMTRHAEVEFSPLVRERAPLISEVMPLIGCPSIRNRGTIGGSVAHADPAADLPVALLALNATLRAQGPRGHRDLPIDDFFVSLFTTALATDEVLTEIRIPAAAPGSGSAFLEFARRYGDFALVAVAVTMRLVRGAIADTLRITLGGVADRPIRAWRAEALLRGVAPTPEAFEAAARAAAGEIDPPADIHGSSGYRRNLTGHFVRLALNQAFTRASDSTAPSIRGGKGRA